MKNPLKKPCNQCPFRRRSLPGYVGADTPEHFIATTLSDVAMPCHSTIDYEDPDWEDSLAADGSARHCAGAAILFANKFKLSRDRTRPSLPADTKNVFKNEVEFLDHHSAAHKRVMGIK